jgi:hypothetical protein
MKKLITGVIVAAALAVMATPAFAIHHVGALSFVVGCTDPNPGHSHALRPTGQGEPQTAHANSVLNTHNQAKANCRWGRN